ncbi:MAG TPA: hypothetical protein VKC35_02150 [Vicinamibacterales bacterium]|nr:hypothetical protein [Vicinamibacterales bacterium]
MRIQGATLTVRVIGELDHTTADTAGLADVPRFTPAGEEVSGPIVLRL